MDELGVLSLLIVDVLELFEGESIKDITKQRSEDTRAWAFNLVEA